MTAHVQQVRHPQRHRAMLEAYGFGLFPLPPYRDARLGRWRIVRHLPSLADGYASGTVVEPSRHVLYHGRTAWMSTGLMEQESHAFHVHQARGLVVAAGLGMGMFAYAAALKPEVLQVVVVEQAAEVIALTRQAAAFEDWPGRDKVTLLEADALGPGLAAVVQAVSGACLPDYLYADIWPTCAAPEAPHETRAMVHALRPRAAGWWGQELSFGLWCRAQGRHPDEVALQEYATHVGVPIPLTPGYAAFCADAIAASLPPHAGRHGRISPWRERLRRLFAS